MPESFVLRGESIDLHRLLKAAGLCGSGGEAKSVIEQRSVRVDGHVEIRKACKIRAGQTVTYDKHELAVEAKGRLGALSSINRNFA
jgi:ribosome-associated protein